jgi:hypothetical protein
MANQKGMQPGVPRQGPLFGLQLFPREPRLIALPGSIAGLISRSAARCDAGFQPGNPLSATRHLTV